MFAVIPRLRQTKNMSVCFSVEYDQRCLEQEYCLMLNHVKIFLLRVIHGITYWTSIESSTATPHLYSFVKRDNSWSSYQSNTFILMYVYHPLLDINTITITEGLCTDKRIFISNKQCYLRRFIENKDYNSQI